MSNTTRDLATVTGVKYGKEDHGVLTCATCIFASIAAVSRALVALFSMR